MKKTRYTESQILSILKEADSGISVADLTRKYGLGHSTIYNWRAKYGGMELSELKRMKQLEEENRRLKSLFAKASLENEILKEAIEGKL
jgi:putative transposase